MTARATRRCKSFWQDAARFGLLISIVIGWLPDTSVGQNADTPAEGVAAVTSLAFAPENRLLIRGSQEGIVALDREGDVKWQLSTELDHVLSLEFSPDHSQFAVAGGSPGISGVVELWSWPQREQVGKIGEHADTVNDMAWHDGGQVLVTASADNTIKVWQAKSGQLLRTLQGHSGSVLALAVSPDGQWLCSASADHTIRVWKTSDWSLRRTLNNHLDQVHDLEFRPAPQANGHPVLASASQDATVRIWYPDIGRMVRIIRLGHPVQTLAYDASGTLYCGTNANLISIGEDGKPKTLRSVKNNAWFISVAAAQISDLSQDVVCGTSDGQTIWLHADR